MTDIYVSKSAIYTTEIARIGEIQSEIDTLNRRDSRIGRKYTKEADRLYDAAIAEGKSVFGLTSTELAKLGVQLDEITEATRKLQREAQAIAKQIGLCSCLHRWIAINGYCETCYSA